MGYIYLLNCWDGEERYKIGVTKHENITKRIKQLQTGNPEEIIELNKFESDNYHKVETMLHRYYGTKHKKGEWFSLEPKQVFEFTERCEKFDGMITMLLKENPYYK